MIHCLRELRRATLFAFGTPFYLFSPMATVVCPDFRLNLQQQHKDKGTRIKIFSFRWVWHSREYIVAFPSFCLVTRLLSIFLVPWPFQHSICSSF